MRHPNAASDEPKRWFSSDVRRHCHAHGVLGLLDVIAVKVSCPPRADELHSFAKPSSILLRTTIVIYAMYAARVALLHLLVVRKLCLRVRNA